MHVGQLTSPEQRVLGALIEKRWTTPDQYPLSVNALRLACNQLTNRDPVTDYDESTVREAAQRLSRYGLARLASGHTSRAIKYRHLAEEALSLGREELAVLAVLLLRGPQTPGEIKARSERMASLDALADVERVLDVLCQRGYARNLGRRPGQKEDRFEQLLGGASNAGERLESDDAGGSDGGGQFGDGGRADAAGRPSDSGQADTAGQPEAGGQAGAVGPQPETELASPAINGSNLESRVTALEAEVAELRRQLSELSASGG